MWGERSKALSAARQIDSMEPPGLRERGAESLIAV